ncbi:DAO domain-containing protein [Fusarium keratoplasticum]|nr:DAO domain-containing protein [Fusarium keratoplasticum]
MKRTLEKTRVKFVQMNLNSLSNARYLGNDILINALGLGTKDLVDVQDKEMLLQKGQILIVMSNYQRAFMRDDGKTYTYVIPRLNGTVILEGVRDPDISNTTVIPDINQDIVRRVNKSLPQHFSANLEDHDIIGHNVGIRPCRTEIRIESELNEGQNIVNAYGINGGGYIFGSGVAREVTKLVDDILSQGGTARL